MSFLAEMIMERSRASFAAKIIQMGFGTGNAPNLVPEKLYSIPILDL